MEYVTRRQRVKKRKRKMKKTAITTMICVIVVSFFKWQLASQNSQYLQKVEFPEYSGEAFSEINGNVPLFDETDKTTKTFERYSDLDILGRCGAAYACISRELMPTEERGGIGNIKPSGWVQAKYEGYVDSNPPYLYNRCHLIAYCLTAENANEKNLITGTRYMNVEGMLPFEKQVANYLDKNDNHVLYRVTPVFEEDNLLASGVLMEAYSVEDQGEGICFCVYCYNVQPGIEIDYKTGASKKILWNKHSHIYIFAAQPPFFGDCAISFSVLLRGTGTGGKKSVTQL